MRGVGFFFSIIASVFVVSCGGITKEEFDKRFGELENRISQIEERQKNLEERNIRTEARVDTLSENLARTRLEVEKLKVQGQSPSQATKIPEPVKEEPKPTTNPPVKEEPKPTTNPTESMQELPQAQDSPMQATEDYQKEYDEALRFYNLRQLNQARDKFIDFIKKYPKTPITDNAYFWLGVTYRDLGETNKAEAVWLTLVERCRRKEMVDCNKAPSAMLQLARFYEQKGESQKVKEYYEAILKEYPLSEEAGFARKRLGK